MKKLLTILGLQRNSPYIRDFFFTENMKSGVYMSVITIVLEAWMIIRLVVKIFTNNLQSQIGHLFKAYFSNYLILISMAIITLVFTVRYLRTKKGSPILGRAILVIFMVISIYFGIRVSVADYAKGEQILTFLSMVLTSVCLLTWRPVVSFFITSVSFMLFYEQINALPAFNTGTQGTTVATQINFFIIWISTMILCVSKYSIKMSQALKDEDLVKMNTYLSKISVEDELTGINNMVFFRSEAEKLLSYSTTDTDDIVFLFFDIENFKSYNEKYGFQEGNVLLKKAAAIIRESFSNSLTARFSDDHFVVLTRFDGCGEIVDNISRKIKALQRSVQLNLKCGAYKPLENDTDVSAACDKARFACNTLKKHFDKDFRLYDRSLEDSFTLKQYIVNNIDTAVEQGWIKVFYQPVIDTKTGHICGYEALSRWKDPIYGLLSPALFITTLEELRQIHKLDCCMIENVCKDFKRALDEGISVVPVSVNFSRLDFELCDIVGELNKISEKYGVEKRFIDVEITESALTEGQESLLNAVRSIRDSGYRVWLDDFGSGYSSLNVLKDYIFDVCKIDMQFLSGFGSNGKTNTILSNVVDLTHQLGMISLTEGVETQEQLDFLRTIGCDMAQGYLFSKPLPYDEITALIKSGKFTVGE